MIYILFDKRTKKTVIRPSIYFNNTYDNDWFTDSLVREIIRGLDSSEDLGGCIKGPIGVLPYELLSTTSKVLITLLKSEDYYETDTIYIGDNAGVYLQEISKLRDIYLTCTGFDLGMDDCYDFEFICVNDFSYGKGRDAWVDKMVQFLTLDPLEEIYLPSVKEVYFNGR